MFYVYYMYFTTIETFKVWIFPFLIHSIFLYYIYTYMKQSISLKQTNNTHLITIHVQNDNFLYIGTSFHLNFL